MRNYGILTLKVGIYFRFFLICGKEIMIEIAMLPFAAGYFTPNNKGHTHRSDAYPAGVLPPITADIERYLQAAIPQNAAKPTDFTPNNKGHESLKTQKLRCFAPNNMGHKFLCLRSNASFLRFYLQ